VSQINITKSVKELLGCFINQWLYQPMCNKVFYFFHYYYFLAIFFYKTFKYSEESRREWDQDMISGRLELGFQVPFQDNSSSAEMLWEHPSMIASRSICM